MEFDKEKGILYLTPKDKKDAGTYEIEAKLTDQNDISTTEKFKITLKWQIKSERKQKTNFNPFLFEKKKQE